jgi:hypothetical protein
VSEEFRRVFPLWKACKRLLFVARFSQARNGGQLCVPINARAHWQFLKNNQSPLLSLRLKIPVRTDTKTGVSPARNEAGDIISSRVAGDQPQEDDDRDRNADEPKTSRAHVFFPAALGNNVKARQAFPAAAVSKPMNIKARAAGLEPRP